MDGPANAPGHGSPPTDRCTATARQTGQRCKRRPIPGGSVCIIHGGAAPQVAAAARQRLQHAATAQAATALGLGNYPSNIPNARAKLTRLRRRQPRWFTTADNRHWEQTLRRAMTHAAEQAFPIERDTPSRPP